MLRERAGKIIAALLNRKTAGAFGSRFDSERGVGINPEELDVIVGCAEIRDSDERIN